MRVSTVSVTGVAASAWLPIDHYTSGYGDGIYLDLGAGATASVEVTPDNVFDPAVTPKAYACGVATLTGATTDVCAMLPLAAVAVRLNQTAGATTSILKVVVRGVT